MKEMKLYTHEEMLDAVVGVKGTPNIEKYESYIRHYFQSIQGYGNTGKVGD